MYDKSTGVFNGKVFVRKDAQQTNAFQQIQTSLQIRELRLMQPELEIYADDVKCSHGCTVGQFDKLYSTLSREELAEARRF